MSNESVGNPVVLEQAIVNAADIPASERSTISLHLLVKNGASVVGRLMDNVGPYVHEVVAVLNDCTDETEEILRKKCTEFNIPFIPTPVTRDTHPELYILDEEATYEVGRPLANEKFGGPFTNRPILADWSTARNVGWNKCTSKWRLFLDADDVVADPECLPGLVKILEEREVELAVSQYIYGADAEGRSFAGSMRERLALNIPRIRWSKVIHECLFGTNRISHLKTNLIVRDMRDSQGQDIRIPGRSFKILYQRARSKDWEVSPRLLADMVQELRTLGLGPEMRGFAEALLDKYLEEATWPEERGWVYAVVGEIREQSNDFEGAMAAYEDSLACHPGSKTAFRLARATFNRACALKAELDGAGFPAEDELRELGTKLTKLESLWHGVIAAYEQGVANKAFHQALDDGPLMEDMEAIHVAGAYLELGENATALTFVEKAAATFTESSALAFMLEQCRKVNAPR